MQKMSPLARNSLIAAAIGASYLVLIAYFNQIEPPTVGTVTEYNDVQQRALASVDALIERGLAVAIGLTGVLGAAILGFNQKLSLSRTDAAAAAVALYFLVLSALCGAFAKVKLAEMLGNGLSPYVHAPIITHPLSMQLYGMVATLAAISWIVVSRAFAWTDPGEKQ